MAARRSSTTILLLLVSVASASEISNTLEGVTAKLTATTSPDESISSFVATSGAYNTNYCAEAILEVESFVDGLASELTELGAESGLTTLEVLKTDFTTEIKRCLSLFQ